MMFNVYVKQGGRWLDIPEDLLCIYELNLNDNIDDVEKLQQQLLFKDQAELRMFLVVMCRSRAHMAKWKEVFLHSTRGDWFDFALMANQALHSRAAHESWPVPYMRALGGLKHLLAVIKG
ncbi:hypothetical protein KIN20_021585 [Parelaphostrongylus tenuis]|uniref:Uncharacterized protein n=1 Tax=Parelaphostrongylus tenuis TaxID=148309 RepID=A0AAD5N5F1_PARTN|nr:hypothetical protein KIN20_021585 [Parelaphostrongylus tenuis]